MQASPEFVGVEPAKRCETSLAAIVELLGALHDAGISYCHWKSSRLAVAVVSGETDLDLLVSPSDLSHAEEILLAHGCKRFPASANRNEPDIVTYVGFDEASGRLFRIDVFSRLVTGHKLLKAYRIPVGGKRAIARGPPS